MYGQATENNYKIGQYISVSTQNQTMKITENRNEFIQEGVGLQGPIDITNQISTDLVQNLDTKAQTNRIKGLDNILQLEKNAWSWQRESRASTKEMIKQGINRGAIILPCSSGKTRIVAEFLKIGNTTKLYLIPKNVIGFSIVEDLIKRGIPREKIIDCSNRELSSKLNNIDISSLSDETIIANYRGLISLRQRNRDLFDELVSKVGITISDEAHRSLGPETRATIDECVAFEGLIKKPEGSSKKNHLHLLFTSTPRLIFKEITDYYPYTIISKTMENIYLESKKSGMESPLVLPKFRRMGPVYLTLDTEIKNAEEEIGEDFFTKYANKIRVFVDQYGDPIEKNMLNEYQKLKNINGGYMPGLGICNTIDQAQKLTEYFQKHGIPARRCTGPNKKYDTDLDYSDLKDFVDKGGVVFTADAITEGVNVPSFRVLMECAYTGSPARVVQSVGRITRSISIEELKHLKEINPDIDESFLKKTSQNTTCLGPSMRWGDYDPKENTHNSDKSNISNTESNAKKNIPLKTFYDFLLDSGEMGYETITREGNLYTGEKKSYNNHHLPGKFKSPDLWHVLREDIKKYSIKPLDKDQETTVIEQCKQGDSKARDILIKSNIRFILYKAKKRHNYYKYYYPTMQGTLNDFFSAGFEGLIESIDKIHLFKNGDGYSFISFIQSYIQKGFIDLFYKDENCLAPISGINIPEYINRTYLKPIKTLQGSDEKLIYAIENNLPNKNDIICDIIGMEEKITKGYSKSQIEIHDSLAKLMDSEMILSPENETSEKQSDIGLIKESLSIEINRILNTLTIREKEILQGFFGLGQKEKGLKELGGEYGLFRQRVSKIKGDAIKKCRDPKRIDLLRGCMPDIDSVPNFSSPESASI